MQLRLASFVYNQRIISPHLSDAGHLHATSLIENQRMRLLSGLNELLFPPRCLGCGSLNEGLCHQCLLDWKISYLQTRVSAISVFSSILYTKTASNILLAAKENGIRNADDLLVEAMHHSLVCAIATCDIPPILIPIPSAPSAIRRRGRNFLLDIADRAGALEDLPIHNLLRHNRKVQDQSLLDARARFENLSGALNVVSHAGRGRDVILVDDLVTTGATLSEANRVLKIAGFAVVGAITACVALPLR